MATRTPIVVQDEHASDIEFVRSIVLDRLRNEQGFKSIDYRWDDTFQDFVRFEPPRNRQRFALQAAEVCWQLMVQGVLVPGSDLANNEFPRFRISEYGRKVLDSGRLSPHDPTGYLEEITSVAATTVGQVAIAYIEEALRCFNSGCHTAATLLLGIASESVLWEVCAIVEESLTSTGEKEKFAKIPENAKSKHRWIVEKFDRLPRSVRRDKLPESLDVTLDSLGDLIRRQRNELGHPQESPPAIDRDTAFVYFRLFPQYIKSLEQFAAYAKENGI